MDAVGGTRSHAVRFGRSSCPRRAADIALDRHIAQHPGRVAELLQRLKLEAGTYRLDDHDSRYRCQHCRWEIIDDQDTHVDG